MKVNFFLSDSRFFDSLDTLLVGSVFAYGGGSTAEGNCLLPDTFILLSDKSEKKIQDIEIGDMVLSYDPISGKYLENKVISIDRKFVQGYLRINKTLKITHDHPLSLSSGIWKEAGEIVVGDSLYTYDGKGNTVTSVEEISGRQVVFNLHLEKQCKSYFADSYLVHDYYTKKLEE